MSKKNIFILLILMSVSGLYAQEKPVNNNWIINEVYTSDKPKRYGLFIELYNPSDNKLPDDLYITDSKKNPQQNRLASKAKYHPDLRTKNYRTVKVSAVRFKRRSVKIYSSTDTLYLFQRIGYEYHVKDSFPVIWNDSLSLGRCGNRICYFNIPTPGRLNKNVAPLQYMPRKNYRMAIFGGASFASNANSNGYFPSVIVRGQKITNKRLFYTATSAAIFLQGYSFNRTRDSLSSVLIQKREKGYHSIVGCWVGKDIGLFLTPRLDVAAGGAVVLGTIAQEVYTDYRTILQPDGSIIEDNSKQSHTIGRYSMPVISFSGALNYQLTPTIRIEALYTLFFRTFQKNEAVYNQSFNIGLSYSFKHKGRGYREGLLW